MNSNKKKDKSFWFHSALEDRLEEKELPLLRETEDVLATIPPFSTPEKKQEDKPAQEKKATSSTKKEIKQESPTSETKSLQKETTKKEVSSGWYASGKWRYLYIFLGVLGVYLSFATPQRFLHQSEEPHFVHLANAFLNHRLDLGKAPYHAVSGKYMGNDWAYIHEVRLRSLGGKVLPKMKIVRGRFVKRAQGGNFRTLRKKMLRIRPQDIIHRKTIYYVSFPPLPALVMAVPMAVFKALKMPHLRFNDSLATFFFAALAVMLFFWMLESFSDKGLTSRSSKENLWFTLLFGFGTVFFYVSVQGTVWFTALVFGACFLIPALRFVLREEHDFLAGLFVGLAFLARPFLILTSLLFLWLLLRKKDSFSLQPLLESKNIRRLLFFASPIAVCLAGMLWINWIRFENPLEFGHLYLYNVYPKCWDTGLFHFQWFPRNFYAFFFLPPLLVSKAPYVQFNAHGLSLFLTTPCFLYLFWSMKRSRYSEGMLWVAFLILLPTLFYQNTGWVTFGNRFSTDYSIFFLVLLAFGSFQFNRLVKGLVVWSIVINLVGAITFGRMGDFYHLPYHSLNWIYQLWK